MTAPLPQPNGDLQLHINRRVFHLEHGPGLLKAISTAGRPAVTWDSGEVTHRDELLSIDDLTPIEDDTPAGPPVDGAELLDTVETFLGRFVAYPSEAAHVAHVLWIAHTWFMDRWDSTPRIAFLSPEPGSGKSRALEVTEPLVPRPIHAVNATPAYLFRKVSDEAGRPTILYDEIDTVFGPKAKDNEDVRGMLNAGHRKGAMAGRAVMKGRRVETEELPAYCAVALAGLNDLPDTIMTRSVVVRMRRRTHTEHVEPWRQRQGHAQAAPLTQQLHRWSSQSLHRLAWPDMPDGIEDRNADVWEALLAMADLAGGDWPARARCSAVTLVTQSQEDRSSLGITLLTDLRTVFGDEQRVATEVLLARLWKLDDSPWSDLRGRPIDARYLARQLGKYGVKPRSQRLGDQVLRGYDAADLADPWSRYTTAVSATSATGSTPDVAHVADVAHVQRNECGGRDGSLLGITPSPRGEQNGPDPEPKNGGSGPVAQNSATSATALQHPLPGLTGEGPR